jgi:hypothetical protein
MTTIQSENQASKKPVEVFSSGGGTQSAAITALIIQGRLPRPDLVAIVDTGRERSSTWEYLDSVIRPALKGIGLEVHRISPEWASVPDHGKDYLSHNGNTLLIPAFTNQSYSIGKLSGFCSARWKVETRQRYLREAVGIPTREQRNWIGFSLDESSRAVRMMNGPEYKDGLIRFPLIDDVPLRRHQAILEVEKMGWPTPPRSACWMCPNQGDDEWRDIKENYPADFARAVALEKEVQQSDPFAWLHKSCVPLDEVDFTKPPELDLFVRACSSGGCFT